MAKTIRLAVLGGNRGAIYAEAAAALGDRVQLTAICDLDPTVLSAWRQRHPGIRVFTDCDDLFTAHVCDAVVIATSMQMHAVHAMAALNAGLHVLCESTACLTHAEAMQLIGTVQGAQGCIYMMAANEIYRRPHMMLQHMTSIGLLGDLTYAEGRYQQDCNHLYYRSDGSLTWRGDLRRRLHGGCVEPVPTLAPIARWLDLGGTDRIVELYCSSGPAAATADYARLRFGAKIPTAKPEYWGMGDHCTLLLRTHRGRTILLREDRASPHPGRSIDHELQGTRGCYRTQPTGEPLIWVHGLSPHEGDADLPRMGTNTGVPSAWQSWRDQQAGYEHPYWREHGNAATANGAEGSVYFTLLDFIWTIEGRIANPIDVLTAVAWSSLIWVSADSQRRRGPVRMPDYFTLGNTARSHTSVESDPGIR